MRLLIFQDYLRVGGTEHHSLLIAEEGKKLGHDVVVVTFRPGGTLMAKATVKGIRTRALQPIDTGVNFWAPGWRQVLNREQPDGVVLMGRCANCLGYRIKAAFPNLKVMATMRTGRPLPGRYWKSLRACDGIIANSSWAKDILLKHGFEENKISIIKNALLKRVDPRQITEWRVKKRGELEAREGELLLLYAAAFVPGKNHVALLQAMALVKGKLSQRSRLILLGRGPLLPATLRLTQRLGLEEDVIFAGYQNPVGPWLVAADLYVSSSMEESYPNAIQEAQQAGLPVIAFDVAGVGETLVDGKSGILVKPGDVDAFAQSILNLAADGERRHRYSEQARQYAESFTTPEAQTRATFGLFT